MDQLSRHTFVPTTTALVQMKARLSGVSDVTDTIRTVLYNKVFANEGGWFSSAAGVGPALGWTHPLSHPPNPARRPAATCAFQFGGLMSLSISRDAGFAFLFEPSSLRPAG